MNERKLSFYSKVTRTPSAREPGRVFSLHVFADRLKEEERRGGRGRERKEGGDKGRKAGDKEAVVY